MFKIALRYVIREKIRTVVSVLGIAVSVMLMFSLVQMGDCIRHQFSEMVTSGMKRDFTIYGVTYGQIQQAEELLLEKGVKDNYLLTMKAGIWYEEDVNPVDVIGVDGNMDYFKDTHLIEGKYPEKLNEICLEASLAQQRSIHIGDDLEIEICAEAAGTECKVKFTVSGIIDNISDDGRRLWTSLETAGEIQRKLEPSDLQGNAIAVVAEQGTYNTEKSADLIVELSETLQLKDFYKEHLLINDEKSYLYNEEESSYVGLSRTLKLVSFLILVCMSIFVFNTCYICAIEKQKELATMRCLGLSEKKKNRILLWEGMIIGHMGIALGAVMGTTLNIMVARKVIHYLMPEIKDVGLVIQPISYIQAYAAAIVAILLAVNRVLVKMRKWSILEVMNYSENNKYDAVRIDKKMKRESVLWAIARRNLHRNPSKSNTLLLTMSLSILLCLVIFSVFFSIDIFQEDEKSKENLFTYEVYEVDVLNTELPEEGCKKIKALLGDKNVFEETCYPDLFATVSGINVRLVCYDDSLMEFLLDNMETTEEIDAKNPLAILCQRDKSVSQDLKTVLFTDIDSKKKVDIPISMRFDGESYVIRSSFGYDFDVVVINDAMAEQLGLPDVSCTGLLLKNTQSLVGTEIKNSFGKKNTIMVDLLNKNRDDEKSQLLGIICIAVYVMIATVLLTAIIISSTLQSNFLIRSREYAIMRAVGLTIRKLIHICCFENLILLFKAFVIGSLLSVPIGIWLGQVLEDGIRWSIFVYGGVLFFFVLLIVVINCVCVKLAFRISILSILKEER